MAMPTAKAVAAASDIPALPASAPATTAPTAIPSGMLCSVTASISIWRLPSDDFMPSGVSELTCWWGTRLSNASRKSMPRMMPTAAGIQLMRPISSARSIAGMTNDHTEAATMTPAAKPSNALCRRCDTLCRAKSTVEAPMTVPTSGARSISVVVIAISFTPSIHKRLAKVV